MRNSLFVKIYLTVLISLAAVTIASAIFVEVGQELESAAFGPAGFFALIAAVIGLVAFPVVRHLTRRLEALRKGADRWGAGALDTRVAVRGSDEVAAVAASFNRAAEQIERLLAAHSSLLANASHELRSPLARLRVAIDLIANEQSGPMRDEIVRNLAELDALVEEILLASRLDHIEKLEQVEPVDLLALTAEKGARFGVDVSGEPGVVVGDPKLLMRLVRNLMQNAQRHGRPPVSARVGIEGGSVVLKVCDHGPGLPEGTGERVFEPFFRPQGSSETAGGWGLGLSLVRKIALRHGATVHHESPSGAGACFVVTFPAYLDMAGAYPCESGRSASALPSLRE
ncbi:HAMP domain-containing sensor histidine kinase [Mesorhizobium sp. WSM3882]|uniref:sensor histidine kinase n=1 Tax=Mesorhizobium sp. WSM3882 TaxID=2029407 RepID=UPI000BB04ECD|nr:HAMP domain-containing sensor histidine kinase [Mesorhizobium sp. WSM3882]PBB28999.1 two-component sensor histidine kinase [Mesorhizobium sp. WSM3882]